MPLIPAHQQRQVDRCKFGASLVNIMRTCLILRIAVHLASLLLHPLKEIEIDESSFPTHTMIMLQFYPIFGNSIKRKFQT